MEVETAIDKADGNSEAVSDDKKTKRASPVSPETLELLAKSHHLHFSDYCKGTKQKPSQKIPKTVWDKIKIDIEEKLGCVLLARNERNLKNALRGFLDSLNTGTANAEGENAKPELQNCDIMLALRDSDVMASKIVQKRHHDIIQGANANKAEKLKDGANQSVETEIGDDQTEADDSDDIVVVSKSEHRRRSIIAIETISKSIDLGTQQAASLFRQQTERHITLKETDNRVESIHMLKQDFLRQSIQKQSQELLKNQLEILSFKKQHNLISEIEFNAEVMELTSASK
jgi:hypothetical protein